MKKEIWKDIHGYKGYYQVSNRGRIKSLARTCRGAHGWNERIVKEIILKGHLDKKNGYLHVGLSKKGIVSILKIHKLVYYNFRKQNKNLPEINHKNGIKTDNRLSNLELVTHQRNSIHAFEMGLRISAKGMKNHSKLTDTQVLKIRSIYMWGDGPELAKRFGVCKTTIQGIITRKYWKHI